MPRARGVRPRAPNPVPYRLRNRDRPARPRPAVQHAVQAPAIQAPIAVQQPEAPVPDPAPEAQPQFQDHALQQPPLLPQAIQHLPLPAGQHQQLMHAVQQPQPQLNMNQTMNGELVNINPANGNAPLLIPMSNELDIFVSQSFKEKIWNFQYIDLSLLSRNNFNVPNESQDCIGVQDERLNLPLNLFIQNASIQ